MKKRIIFLVLVVIITQLFAYRPNKKSFSNEYLYSLYCSWLENSNFFRDAPASLLTAGKIELTYQSRSELTAKCRFILADGKIVKLAEILPAADLPPFLSDFAEQALFRLNAKDYCYINDYLQQLGGRLEAGGKSQEAAFAFIKEQNPRFIPLKIEVIKRENSFQINMDNGKILVFTYLENRQDWQEAFTRFRQHEFFLPPPTEQQQAKAADGHPQAVEPKTFLKQSLPSNYNQMFEVPSVPDRVIDTDNFSDLGKYLVVNRHNPLVRKIMNNQVENADDFLKKQLPRREISLEKGIYHAKLASFGPYQAELYLSAEKTKNGLKFNPAPPSLVQDGKIILGANDVISAPNFCRDELQEIAPFLAQLVALHRSLGTELFHFLVEPDGLKTTLVLYDKTREVIDFDTYSALLFHLHQYWQGKDVYYSLDTLKRINGDIEFKAYLLVKGEKNDFAEIRYHLNKEYRLNVVMMILYPQVENTLR